MLADVIYMGVIVWGFCMDTWWPLNRQYTWFPKSSIFEALSLIFQRMETLCEDVTVGEAQMEVISYESEISEQVLQREREREKKASVSICAKSESEPDLKGRYVQLMRAHLKYSKAERRPCSLL